jgi:DNA polymerase-2
LENEGKSLKAGEILKYVITDYYHCRKRGSSTNRAIHIELIDDDRTYDVRRYIELLAEICNSIIEPFGYIVTPKTNFTPYIYNY